MLLSIKQVMLERDNFNESVFGSLLTGVIIFVVLASSHFSKTDSFLPDSNALEVLGVLAKA